MCLAVPMKIVELVRPDRAIVDSEGVSMEISLKLVEHADVGDYVIVHAGFAIEVLDLDEAEKTLELLREIAEAGENNTR